MTTLNTYGERRLDSASPPRRATGLIIREGLFKDEQTTGGIIRPLQVKRWFIFRKISGTYDYGKGQDERTGAFKALMGYWHFETEEERDTEYNNLITQGFKDW